MGLKVVVTGGASGIGRATALRFAKDGHEVFVTDRNDAKLSETVQLAEEIGTSKVGRSVGDVGVEGDVQRIYAEAIEALGGQIDVVVLSAGYFMMANLEDCSAKDFDIFNTNVRGVFLWLKAVLPDFKARASGQIVIMNSVAGEDVEAPMLSLYAASKFAITGLAQALRLELQGSGIKVATVLPGLVDTNIFSAPIFAEKGIDINEIIARAGTILLPEDIAGAIATIAYQSTRSDIEKIKVRH